MAAELELRDLQTWLQTFIVEPGSTEEALHKAEEATGLQQDSAQSLVLPSPTLNPTERLEIYRSMYLLRMEEALSIDYPAVRHFLGERPFFALVSRYVKEHPSRSYTLDRLGDRFAHFLKDDPSLDQRGFLHDLARLEYALCEVFHDEEQPVVTPLDLAAVAPEDWEKARLVPIAALRLLAMDFNANDYYKAFNRDDEPPLPERCPDWVVVWRQDFRVWRMPLGRGPFSLLSRLRDGATLGEAISLVLSQEDLAEAQLFECFSSWIGEGMFTRIETDPV